MPSLLSDLKGLMDALGIPCETGVLTGKAPDTYAVLTPIQDYYSVAGDDVPLDEVQEVRVSLFTRGNYRAPKRSIEAACLAAGLCVTDRRYVGREDDTGFFHYALDFAGCYSLELEE